MTITSIYLIGLLSIKCINTCEVPRTEQAQCLMEDYFFNYYLLGSKFLPHIICLLFPTILHQILTKWKHFCYVRYRFFPPVNLEQLYVCANYLSFITMLPLIASTILTYVWFCFPQPTSLYLQECLACSICSTNNFYRWCWLWKLTKKRCSIVITQLNVP